MNTTSMLTSKVHKALKLAELSTKDTECSFITTGHILLGVFKEGSGIGYEILRNLGVTEQQIKDGIKKLVQVEV
jgi:ATP-dependent Clp protease ATP-binding subunit ClpA